MEILDRVTSRSNICNVQLSFTGLAKASITSGWQPFYNSSFEEADFQKAYATLSSIDYEEESNTTSAGTSYNQKVIFRFPMHDAKRAERIALMQKIKFVKLSFSNKIDIVLGRNDHNQNTKPRVKIKTNSRICEVAVESQSIFPSGFDDTFYSEVPIIAGVFDETFDETFD